MDIKKQKHNICVVGAGHVGLVAAACFAQLGHNVICSDNDRNKIKDLARLKMPFYEPRMADLVKKNFKKKTLVFTSDLAAAVKKSQVIFVAVGTPPLEDGSADLTAVENVARVVAANLNEYKLVVGKSTVPVQTGRHIKETISRYRKNNNEFDVASNPEFLREGKAVSDFFGPDRIVIGVESERAEEILKGIYACIKAPIIVTNINTAELIKHASNSFLATKISFINAVSRVCDLAGADVEKVAQAMGMDKRIGRDFLDAGLGYGGFCFPKDLEAFIYISQKLGYDFSLLKSVQNINEKQPQVLVDKIKEHMWILKDKKIAVLGLSFKPDTDDMRFAPSISLVNRLVEEGARPYLFDPQSNQQAKKSLKHKNITFCKDVYAAIKGSDCLCLVTEWQEFKSLDFKKVFKLMNYPLIADGRNFFNKEELSGIGFKYIGMGRGK